MVTLKATAKALCAFAIGMCATNVSATETQRALGPALEPGQKASGRVLRGELLRRCVTLHEELLQLNIRLQTLQSNMDVNSRVLDRMDGELDAAEAAMGDRTDADAVARYNRIVERQHEIIAQHDALLPEQHELVARQNPRVAEFNAKCAGITYYRKDWLNTDVVIDPDLMPPATKF